MCSYRAPKQKDPLAPPPPPVPVAMQVQAANRSPASAAGTGGTGASTLVVRKKTKNVSTPSYGSSANTGVTR